MNLQYQCVTYAGRVELSPLHIISHVDAKIKLIDADANFLFVVFREVEQLVFATGAVEN